MKKTLFIITVISAMIIIAGCGDKVESKNSKAANEIVTETVPVKIHAESSEESKTPENNNTTKPILTREYAKDNVSFLVDEEWEEYSGQDGAFAAQDKKSFYCLQGVSELGSYTPQEFYENLLSGYKNEYEIISSDKTISDFTTADGIPSQIGRIEMSRDGIIYTIDVLIVPQKNTVVTFASQVLDKNDLLIDIREITNTANINIANEDYISGKTFIANDNSELCLKENGEFIYYKSKDDHEEAFCTGKYEVYCGQEAIDKADSMKDYGLTKEEQEQALTANMNGYKLGGPSSADILYPDKYYDSGDIYQICKDSYYTVILHNEKLVQSGSTSDMGNDTLYIGFYIPEIDYADMINAGTANYVGWTLRKH